MTRQILIVKASDRSYWYAQEIGVEMAAEQDGKGWFVQRPGSAIPKQYIDERDFVFTDNEPEVKRRSKQQEAQEIFDNADIIPCRFCGAPAKLSWKRAGFSIECVKRFDGCPMNARTHRDPDIHEVIIRWQPRPYEKL